jgi:hypothetical protein
MKIIFKPKTEAGAAALEKMSSYTVHGIGTKNVIRNGGKIEYITLFLKNRLFNNNFSKNNVYVRNMIISTWQDIVNNEYNVTSKDVGVDISDD